MAQRGVCVFLQLQLLPPSLSLHLSPPLTLSLSGIFCCTPVAISAAKQKQTAEATTATNIVYIVPPSLSLPLSLYVSLSLLHTYVCCISIKYAITTCCRSHRCLVRFMKIIHSPPQCPTLPPYQPYRHHHHLFISHVLVALGTRFVASTQQLPLVNGRKQKKCLLH